MKDLVELARGRRVVALTGAGCSTESGIPDYRGVDTPPRTRPPIQHREFVDKPEARRRYWARSVIGWPRLGAARPNAAHHALTALERTGVLEGVITQNVDGLHHAAGSERVVELHGALRRVRCLTCDAISARDELQARLLAANPRWQALGAPVDPAGRAEPTPLHFRPAGRAEPAPLHFRPAGRAEPAPLHFRPDGDVELADELVAAFEVVACAACGGVLMPDVVFFGGSVPRATLDAAWSLFDRAELLLVIGSSLAVFSGYRFVRRAAERDVPVAIINRGPTRGDELAQLRVDARCGEILPNLARALA